MHRCHICLFAPLINANHEKWQIQATMQLKSLRKIEELKCKVKRHNNPFSREERNVLVLRGCTFKKSKCFVVLMLVITVEIITGKRLLQNCGKSSRNELNFDSTKLGYYANLLCTGSNCWWFRADLLRIARCLSPPSFKELFCSFQRVLCSSAWR